MEESDSAMVSIPRFLVQDFKYTNVYETISVFFE